MSGSTEVNLKNVVLKDIVLKAQIAQREWAANPLARSTALSKAAEIFKAHQTEIGRAHV